MAESKTHLRLVSELVSWIATKFFYGNQGSLLIDLYESPPTAKPPSINGYVPDVIGLGLTGGAVIIGEAKTTADLENRHTKAQLEAFLSYCAVKPNSIFVFAVPWHMTRYARTLLKNIGKACNCRGVSTVVLEKLEG